MNTIRKITLLATTLFLVLTSLFIVPISAANDPWLNDAQVYAEYHGVTVDEALYRFKIQQIAGPLGGELSTNEPETYAGMWMEHMPVFKIVIQFTYNGADTIKGYLPRALGGVVEVRTAQYSLAELEQTKKEMLSVAQRLGIRVMGGIDVKNNKAVIKVVEREQLDCALRSNLIDMPENVDIRTISAFPCLTTDIYGGVLLRYQSFPNYSPCSTAGFPVISPTGTKGITTAGHADNNLRYGGLFGTNLTYQAGVYEGSYDVQWHTCPGLTVLPEIYDGSGNRTIYSVIPRSSQQVGWWVYKYGITTGRTGGYISDLSAGPINDILTGETFVEVYNSTGYDPFADEGDSGGPWFFGTAAYGTTVAVSQDKYTYAYYMAVDYIYSGLGVGVYVG